MQTSHLLAYSSFIVPSWATQMSDGSESAQLDETAHIWSIEHQPLYTHYTFDVAR